MGINTIIAKITIIIPKIIITSKITFKSPNNP